MMAGRRVLKKPTRPTRDGIRKDYDFSPGERGKYARRSAQGTNVVVLDPDVAKSFPDSKSVNASLRKLIHRKIPAT
jgi:hypothetical protein